MNSTSPIQAMVLAAGLGTRLWPLTLDRAKPAVPFLNRPLITHALRLLASHGIRKIAVNTHHCADTVRAAVASVRDELDLEVGFSHEAQILGTAGCLPRAIELGLLDPELPTLIINGKLFTDLDLSAALRSHFANDAAVTMVLRPNGAREAFREVLVDDGHVIGFGATIEPSGPAPLLFTGVHVLAPQVLATIPSVPSDTVRDIYPRWIERRSVHAHVVADGRWWELSTPQRYLDLHVRAHAEGLAPSVHCDVNASVHPQAMLEHTVLWEGARVGAGARLRRVIIGADVHIDDGTEISDVIVVRRSLLDEPRYAMLRGDLAYVSLQ